MDNDKIDDEVSTYCLTNNYPADSIMCDDVRVCNDGTWTGGIRSLWTARTHAGSSTWDQIVLRWCVVRCFENVSVMNCKNTKRYLVCLNMFLPHILAQQCRLSPQMLLFIEKENQLKSLDLSFCVGPARKVTWIPEKFENVPPPQRIQSDEFVDPV